MYSPVGSGIHRELNSYSNFNNWLKNNERRIEDHLRNEGEDFISECLGSNVSSLTFDNNWHYLTKNQKYGYVGSF